jgi:hypothetical protein
MLYFSHMLAPIIKFKNAQKEFNEVFFFKSF